MPLKYSWKQGREQMGIALGFLAASVLVRFADSTDA